MAAGIITILASLIPFAVFLFRKRIEGSPERQNANRKEIAQRDIATRDSQAASVAGVNDLDALERLRRLRDAGANHPQ